MRRVSLLIAGLLVLDTSACRPHDIIHRPERAPAVAVMLDRFVLETEPRRPREGGGRAADTAHAAEAAAGSVLGSRWRVAPHDAGVFEMLPVDRTEAEVSVGGAWERAYALRDRPGVVHAEPLFEVERAPGEIQGTEVCRLARTEESFLFPGQDLPEAAGDPEWSLGPRGANVLLAKQKIRALGREPGTGIIVGHPDTGYRRHPEIWPSRPPIPVLADRGWNFLTDDSDPTDDLTFIFAGHGTRTASVIVSPDGDQLQAGPHQWVTGVAPGARLIPMRVTRSVAMFSMSNLAQAIRRAAGLGPHPLPGPVDVVSISLGGPPSRDLHRAVREATSRNVIVLAAAGNEVRVVVWPARYSEVTAVAASNVERQPWKGSSGGPDVDVTAPGESVWCAGSRAKDGVALDCTGMSSGTSFAVATTAGVAALWLDYHRDDPRLRALRQRKALAWGFREVLRKTARPGPQWDAKRFGPGIVDALAVLEAEVPAPPRVVEAAPSETPCEADLSTLLSLFELTTARPRTARLLRVSVDDLCRVALVADEIVFHLALDEPVRDKLEPLFGAQDPSEGQYEQARNALRAADLSLRLRSVLGRRP